jgi:hypothetical protein
MGFLDKLMFWKKQDDFSAGQQDIGNSPNSYDIQTDFSTQTFDQQGRGYPDMNSQVGNNYSMPQMNNNPMNDSSSAMAPASFGNFNQQQPQIPRDHNLEVISAKLDAIKATLDAVNQRLANLERVAYQDDTSQQRRW